MFRKINNKLLAIVFASLFLIVILIFVLDTGKNERTFRDVLVDIDSTAVTEILIYPKSKNHEEVKLFKEEDAWKVLLQDGKTTNVSAQRVTNIFNQLLAIVPKRLAARGEEKWGEFQVDSTGSRVKIMEGDMLSLDLVIGRFSFQQPRTMNSFVRLFNDTDVYEVDGFLDMTFNQDANAFRDGTVIQDDSNKWQQLRFDYPADSSFTLIKSEGEWRSDRNDVDSAKVVNYLRRLSRLSNTSFLDDIQLKDNIIPTYSVSITTEELKFIELKGYVDSAYYAIHSSENPEVLFDGNSVGNTIFVGLSNFLP